MRFPRRRGEKANEVATSRNHETEPYQLSQSPTLALQLFLKHKMLVSGEWTVDSDAVPAGYATTYSVPGAPSRKKGNGSAKNPANSMSWTLPEGGDFAFITIRLAGHMVPAYQPRAALSFFERFLKYESF